MIYARIALYLVLAALIGGSYRLVYLHGIGVAEGRAAKAAQQQQAAIDKAQDLAEVERAAQEARLQAEAAAAANNEQEARNDAHKARKQLDTLIRTLGSGGRCLDEPRRVLINSAIEAAGKTRGSASNPGKPAGAMPAIRPAGKR